ncbi:MAG: hypothetical protein U0W24_08575 [Bacteroidales bacterium]
MKIIQRLLNNFKSSDKLHLEEIEALLNKTKFLIKDKKADFYDELFRLIIKRHDNNTSDYQIFYDEISMVNKELIVYFEKALISGLTKESLDEFCDKHSEILTKKYSFPATNAALSSYWYQIIRTLNKEIKESLNYELKQRFEPCYIKLDQVSRKAFGIT